MVRTGTTIVLLLVVMLLLSGYNAQQKCQCKLNLLIACLECPTNCFLSRNKCIRCPSSCLTCENSTYCTRCYDGFWGSTCSHICGNCLGKKCSTLTGTCLNGCEQGMYSPQNVARCVQCQPNCIDCSADKCLKCKPGFVGKSCEIDCALCKNGLCRFGGCTEGCKDGYFSSHRSSPCKRCYHGCKSCESLSNCTSCFPGSFGKFCEHTCNPFCKNAKCNQATGVCINGCRNGYYKDQSNCLRCTSCGSCLTYECKSSCCEVITQPVCELKYCDTCRQNDLRFCSDCWNGYYVVKNGTCERCPANCEKKICGLHNGTCRFGCIDGWKGNRCEDRLETDTTVLPNPDQEQDEDKPSWRNIAIGAGIGSAAFVLLVVVIICRKRKKRRRETCSRSTNDRRGGKERKLEKCPICKGTGIQVRIHQLAPGIVQQTQSPCCECYGKRGRIKQKLKCKTGNGKKVVDNHKKLKARVDKGAKNENRSKLDTAYQDLGMQEGHSEYLELKSSETKNKNTENISKSGTAYHNLGIQEGHSEYLELKSSDHEEDTYDEILDVPTYTGRATETYDDALLVPTGRATETYDDALSVPIGRATETYDDALSVPTGRATEIDDDALSVPTGRTTETYDDALSVPIGRATETDDDALSVPTGRATETDDDALSIPTKHSGHLRGQTTNEYLDLEASDKDDSYEYPEAYVN